MKKNILITGSTDGIGKLTALKFANEGHKIFLHGRNQNKLDQQISEFKALSVNQDISGFVADLSDLESVDVMAEKVKQEVKHLDVLINNAGVFKSADIRAKNGMDIRFVVNYLAPFSLTTKLLPLLMRSSEPRILNLSTAAQAPISYDAMLGKVSVSDSAAYAMSKLALTMWNNYVASKLEDVTVIAVNPGSFLNTNMVKEAYGQSWAPAEKGADILYDLAINEEHRAMSGRYFDNDNGTYANAHQDAYDQALIEKLIEITNKIIE